MSRGVDSSLWPWILLGLLVLLSATALARGNLDVREVHTQLDGLQYVLSASVDLDMGETALEALDNGVPLTIVFHIQVRRKSAWLWEDSLLDLQLRYAIRYKPLSERYEVYRLPGGKGKDFVTREAAIRALGELTGIPLISSDSLAKDAEYEVQIKAFLDLEELPLPLRPAAYLKPSWKLSSGWSKWPLTP